MRRGQRILRVGVEHRGAWGGAFAAFAEHQRIMGIPGAQRRDAEVVKAGFTQLEITL
jgi:hypothetical protein